MPWSALRMLPLAQPSPLRNLSRYGRSTRNTTSSYSLASLRYDLSKLRAKSLVEKTAPLPTLPIAGHWLFNVPHFPQALRAYLRTTHRRAVVPLPADRKLQQTA